MHKLWRRAILVAACVGPVQSVAWAQAPGVQALQPFVGTTFPPMYRQAIDTYFSAEAAYRRQDYQEADRILQALWAQTPPGDVAWKQMQAASVPLHKIAHFGTPPGYAALLMLTECVAWRLAEETPVVPRVLYWTVVLVGTSSGADAQTPEDVAANRGPPVTHALDPALTDAVLDASTWLFEEYVRAMTRGHLQIKRVLVRLPNVDVRVGLRAGGVQLSRAASERVWAAVPPGIARATHWWHIIYPSHVPKGAAFAGERFVTGGMRAGPRGKGSPCFVSEDWKFLRAPHQDGGRALTNAERRVALPQWFQHEFFHYVFAAYRQLGLEAKPHQWHNRKLWPQDFVGRVEADYYAEALHKRLQEGVTPPLAERFLRH